MANNIAVCAIAKYENLYIRYWVEYYKKLGFDKIYLYDNNDIDDGECIEHTLMDYIYDGFVEITDVRGVPLCQIDSYNKCFELHHDECDWILYIDCDEYLTLQVDSNIREYLSRFNQGDINAILINWLTMDDNEQLYYENKSPYERFTSYLSPTTFTDNGRIINTNVKTFINANTCVAIKYNEQSHSPYIPYSYVPIKKVNSANIDIPIISISVYPIYYFAYIRHIYTMSATEFMYKRLTRATDAIFPVCLTPEMCETTFFKYNKKTEEKTRIIKNIIKDTQHELPKIAVCCIVKNETLYLRNWAKYLIDMGIDTIILYDNNDIDDLPVEYTIMDYINDGKIIVKDVRGIIRKVDDLAIQMECYNNCFDEYKSRFDWIMFIDADEYIWLDECINNIRRFFDATIIKKADVVQLNWNTMSDNNELYYKNIEDHKRFCIIPKGRKLCNINDPGKNIELNKHIKSCVKCANISKIYFENPHSCEVYRYDNQPGIYINSAGKIAKNSPFSETVEHSYLHITHFRTRSITEFLYRRFARQSYACMGFNIDPDKLIQLFFDENTHTPEKDDIINNFKNNSPAYKNYKMFCKY